MLPELNQLFKEVDENRLDLSFTYKDGELWYRINKQGVIYGRGGQFHSGTDGHEAIRLLALSALESIRFMKENPVAA